MTELPDQPVGQSQGSDETVKRENAIRKAMTIPLNPPVPYRIRGMKEWSGARLGRKDAERVVDAVLEEVE